MCPEVLNKESKIKKEEEKKKEKMLLKELLLNRQLSMLCIVDEKMDICL